MAIAEAKQKVSEAAAKVESMILGTKKVVFETN